MARLNPKAGSVVISAFQWRASKLNPKKYGDKLAHTGADGEGPIEISIAQRLSQARKNET